MSIDKKLGQVIWLDRVGNCQSRFCRNRKEERNKNRQSITYYLPNPGFSNYFRRLSNTKESPSKYNKLKGVGRSGNPGVPVLFGGHTLNRYPVDIGYGNTGCGDFKRGIQN